MTTIYRVKYFVKESEYDSAGYASYLVEKEECFFNVEDALALVKDLRAKSLRYTIKELVVK